MINLVIGSCVNPPPKKRNVYEVVVTVMSGDGDNYEDMSVTSADIDKVSAIVSLMRGVIGAYGYGDRDEVAANAVFGADEQKFWAGKEEMLDWYFDFVGQDVTCHDGSPATPDSMEVFWYDPAGIKHNVLIEKIPD